MESGSCTCTSHCSCKINRLCKCYNKDVLLYRSDHRLQDEQRLLVCQNGNSKCFQMFPSQFYSFLAFFSAATIMFYCHPDRLPFMHKHQSFSIPVAQCRFCFQFWFLVSDKSFLCFGLSVNKVETLCLL